MKQKYISAFLFLVVVLVVAFCSLFAGQSLMHGKMQPQPIHTSDWHSILHKELALTKEQGKAFNVLEKDFVHNKTQLKEQMLQANMHLADVLKEDKSYSVRVQTAIDGVHRVMGQMQKQTIQHLLSMRPLLTAPQNKKLEQLITHALYQGHKRASQ